MIHVRSTRGKNSQGRKVTGIEPMPGEDKVWSTKWHIRYMHVCIFNELFTHRFSSRLTTVVSDCMICETCHCPASTRATATTAARSGPCSGESTPPHNVNRVGLAVPGQNRSLVRAHVKLRIIIGLARVPVPSAA